MSKTIYTHKHHIIPRHAGGTDDPSNLIELSIEDHSLAHKKLYEDHGRWQDKLAWQALSGMIGKEEIILESISHKGARNPMYGRNHTQKSLDIMSDKKIGNNNPMYGRKHTDETKSKMSASGVKTDKWKAYMSKLKTGVKRPVVICPHCNKSGGTGLMHRWHFDNCKAQCV